MITNNNFEQKLLKWDNKLSIKYPLNKRLWKTFEKVYPDEFLEIQNKNVGSHESIKKLWEVIDWYKKQYPQKSHILDSLGYKPFILNNKLYHIKIKLLYDSNKEKQNNNILSLIEDMSNSDKLNLSDQKLQTIENEYKIGCDFLFKLNQLENKLNDLDSGIAELLEAGIFDIHIALSSFQSHFYYDAQPVMFHAHQAVEKFLKALFINNKLSEIQESNKSIDEYCRKFSHKITFLGDELNNIYDDFLKTKKNIDKLNKEVPDMNIRYRNSNKNLQNAIKCIDLMIDPTFRTS